MATIFIDGQAGTTGLELSERLATRADVSLLEIDTASRKSPEARRCLMNEADITVLCLPDDAAREAVTLAGSNCRLLDASTAHRVADGWVYGCPELAPVQREAITGAQHVSNPGCYPQGFILLVRPLIDAGLLDPATCLSMFGISGYSGGGRPLIERYQGFSDAEGEQRNTRPYALSLAHKHVPEMMRYAAARFAPLFAPCVGNFYRGLIVEVPLFTRQLAAGADINRVQEILAARYADEAFVMVHPVNSTSCLEDGYLDATACNYTNRIELLVFGHAEQILLMARYDNLGKGAAGAALQNLNLMLGVDEKLGLDT